MEKTHKYSNKDITVVWKPDTCIHSTLCWKGLIEVFNPRERPWIKMDKADTEKIIAQVSKCPSGALSYYWNEGPGEEAPDAQEAEKNKIQGSSPVTKPVIKIEVTANGPYLLNTECVIIHSDGREEIKPGQVALCRCGGSGTKPFCDGSHKKRGFLG